MVALIAATAALAGCGAAETGSDSGNLRISTDNWRTDFTRHSVDLGEIDAGGPPKDGIPPIDAPHFVSNTDATFLSGREPVVAVSHNGSARAYPLQILLWHEIVNDTLAGLPLSVTYCPLCNTALVFDRRVDGRTLDFGTSGNLRNSDLVMYDRQTESWWQQFSGEAIVGELTDTTLTRIPSRLLSFDDFRATFPAGQVLSRQTGHERPYGTTPYAGYDAPGSQPLFDASNSADRRLDAKERVVFVEREGASVAVPFSALSQRRTITFSLSGERLTVRWQPGVASALDADEIASGRDVGSAQVTAADGQPVAFDEPFWFAVAAFAPKVRIVRDSDAR